MVDHNSIDFGDMQASEASRRFNALWGRMQESQFGLQWFEQADAEDLHYIAGHRNYTHPADANSTEAERRAAEIQQKVRGNALRAKDQLDYRQLKEQHRALLASTEAVRRTAWATIAAAGFAGLAAIASFIGATKDPKIETNPTIEVKLDQSALVGSTTTVP